MRETQRELRGIKEKAGLEPSDISRINLLKESFRKTLKDDFPKENSPQLTVELSDLKKGIIKTYYSFKRPDEELTDNLKVSMI